jgi:hypothetical protein
MSLGPLLALLPPVPAAAAPAQPAAPAAAPRSAVDHFELRVRPVLLKHCVGCHGPDKQRADLRVDGRAALLQGGKHGPAIVPGAPAASLLVKAIRHAGADGKPAGLPGGLKELTMPKDAPPLGERDITAIEAWIKGGAPWPGEVAGAGGSRDDRYRKLAAEHWAFQPVRRHPAPAGPNAGQGAAAEAGAQSASKAGDSFIDAFLDEAIARAGLAAAPQADRRTLIRRASYVLHGLLPTPEEIERFAADKSPRAWERLVDRLLTSPRFGERWARHLLDLARYGETRGYEWNYEIIGAWRYRDYLIRALNADVPYDQLVREHVAGDLLERPRIDRKAGVNESIIGTSFFRLGEAGHDDPIKFREIALDVVDNQIDTLTKAFLGLTVNCSRCHNHKLDPIPTEDYYGLYGVLNSSRQVTHPIDTPEVTAAVRAELGAGKRKIRTAVASLWQGDVKDVERLLRALVPGADASGVAGVHAGRLEAWRKALAGAPAGTGEARPPGKTAKSGKAAAAAPGAREPALEDPGTPWRLLAGAGGGFAKAAAELTARYANETEARAAWNREHYVPFGVFGGDLDATGWQRSGAGLLDGGTAGDLLIAPEGERAVAGVLPAGVFTHRLSGRLDGALRSPDLPKDKKFLSLRVQGGHLAARRTLIDNCSIGDNYQLLGDDTLSWQKLQTHHAEARLPVYVELVTRWENPRLPERPGSVKPPHDKLLGSPRSYFGITRAVLHDVDEPPREELGHMQRLFQGGAPRDAGELAARYAMAVRDLVERFGRGAALDDDDARWLDWLVRNELLRADAAAPKLKPLVAAYRASEAKIRAPRVIEGMADAGPGRDYPVLVGGDFKNPGAVAPRRLLRYLMGEEALTGGGSGRRALAELIASPKNPLTSRVLVNRLWHHVFGRGLVATVDNVGLIGDKPSHPELLDELAARFVEDGWSIKKTLRLLLTSRAFQRSGEASPKAREQDPENALLARAPLRRMDAESLRDNLLAVSGKLRAELYGESVQPFRDKPQDYRRLFAGPLDGDGRRSVYLKVTRMEGPKFLETFDYPNPMATRGARDVTNVPAQALTLMNDPFVIAAAEGLAERVLRAPPKPAGRAAGDDRIAARIDGLFRLLLGRLPSDDERARFAELARKLGQLHEVGQERWGDDRAIWRDVAHATLNLKEVLYVP